MSTTKLTAGMERPPFFKQKGFRVFSSMHWCLCSLPLHKRSCCKSLEEMLLDGVVNAPAIVDFFLFCSHDRLTGYTFFLLKEQSTGHVQVKNMVVLRIWSIFILFCDGCLC